MERLVGRAPPFPLSIRRVPPTIELFSYQSNKIERSASASSNARPEEPAPVIMPRGPRKAPGRESPGSAGRPDDRGRPTGQEAPRWTR